MTNFELTSEDRIMIHKLVQSLYPNHIPFVQYVSKSNGQLVGVFPAPAPMPDGLAGQVAALIESGAQFNTWVEGDDGNGDLHMTIGQFPAADFSETLTYEQTNVEPAVANKIIMGAFTRLINAAFAAMPKN